jgi:hypothetical protein
MALLSVNNQLEHIKEYTTLTNQTKQNYDSLNNHLAYKIANTNGVGLHCQTQRKHETKKPRYGDQYKYK